MEAYLIAICHACVSSAARELVTFSLAVNAYLIFTLKKFEYNFNPLSQIFAKLFNAFLLHK